MATWQAAASSAPRQEVTETRFMWDFSDSARQIHGWRRTGISVALDDLGSGYSSPPKRLDPSTGAPLKHLR